MSEFTPFARTSLNITATINEVSKDRSIDKKNIDFDLLAVETFTQSTKDEEWKLLKEPLEKIFDKEIIQSNALQIRQEYKLGIRPYKQNIFFKNIDMKIVSNKARSKVIAIFKQGTIFPCDNNLAKYLKREITRKKLRLGLLTGHFESGLNATLIKLTKSIKCDTALKKDIKIVIASSYGPILTVNDSIVFHYKKAQLKKNSMIDGVDVKELIYEYIKPLKGTDGRNCSGNFIITQEPKILFTHIKADEETLEKVEDEKSIKYYAKINGYVKELNNAISISNEVSLASASLRDTGSIDTGENKDISVSINANDSSDDAIGTGMTIDVKELNVKGTIGSNTKVKAHELTVGEQTHRNSQLEAVENAKIHLHRGNLKAKTAEIEILENGIVVADDIHVKKMLGGEIIGHRIIVEEVTSNTIIIASESIEVHTISGDHNKFIIDPNKIGSYHEKIEALKIKLRTIKTELKMMKEEHDKKVLDHHKKLDRINVFKARVQKATKTGKTPNKVDMLRVRQYNIDAEKLQIEAKNIVTKKNDISTTNSELEKLYEAELHAKIMHKGKYDGRTQIIFKDTKTSQEYTMLPNGMYKELFLKKTVDGKEIAWN